MNNIVSRSIGASTTEIPTAQQAGFVPRRFLEDNVSALALVHIENLASLLRTCSDEQFFPSLPKLQQAGLLNTASVLADELEDMLSHLNSVKS